MNGMNFSSISIFHPGNFFRALSLPAASRMAFRTCYNEFGLSFVLAPLSWDFTFGRGLSILSPKPRFGALCARALAIAENSATNEELLLSGDCSNCLQETPVRTRFATSIANFEITQTSHPGMEFASKRIQCGCISECISKLRVTVIA